MTLSARSAATKARLQTVALDLFEQRGFDDVTVEQIAAAAGVSHMTFFRLYGSKEAVLLEDPFDPLIAQAVATQDRSLPAVERIAAGLLSVLQHLDTAEDDATRRRIRIALGNPRLEAGMAANTRATQDAIRDIATTDDERRELRIAAAGCLGAVMTALLEWAAGDGNDTLADAVAGALHIVVPGIGAR
ncbi:TetR/AcrR family transcriptional regulator [Demequina sp. TTPB684]|uniref:TetR family transcriptional regulator n=1 Tax=unclassified Demequina TaxID=2620311 RepID=UPI001CF1269C|nr:MULTISPECIES: TetR family transcriptional regulator [unclassified Demequina]MCB2411927.1 TetR/AcrR family transcriptional regulator [Demequina sp. TTPB684]UPU88050.1 TetR/AcrR family transcriptional regulator [Demequina sp. TMPB413]